MEGAIPPASVHDLARDPSAGPVVRTQNFSIQYVRGGATQAFAGADEFILLLDTCGATLAGEGSALALPPRAVAIVPPGAYRLTVQGDGPVILLATDRSDLDLTTAINAEAYATPDPRVAPVGEAFARIDSGALRVFPIDDVPLPKTNPRIKFIQSATMSINWVEYTGVRDRRALSPHAHADLEQASLALAGDFVHHTRTMWGPNAELWRDDAHLAAGPGTVLVVPPEIIHTSEGAGDGRHLLIDIFAPPRRDFIARDWMHNAADYCDPAASAQAA